MRIRFKFALGRRVTEHVRVKRVIVSGCWETPPPFITYHFHYDIQRGRLFDIAHFVLSKLRQKLLQMLLSELTSRMSFNRLVYLLILRSEWAPQDKHLVNYPLSIIKDFYSCCSLSVG